MNATIPHGERRLPLTWLFLPWCGFLITQLVIGTIAAVGQSNPHKIVTDWGLFPDFTMFALVLYVFGTGIAVGILSFLLRSRGFPWSALGIKGSLDWSGVGLAALGVLGGSVLYIVVEYLTGIMGIPMYWYGDVRSLAWIASPGSAVLTLVVAVFVGPFVEEVIFRGYVLTALLGKGIRPWPAMMLSSLIFMSVHVFYGPGILAFTFLWAFIPALLYLRTKRLYSAVLFHVVNNFIAFVLVPIWV